MTEEHETGGEGIVLLVCRGGGLWDDLERLLQDDGYTVERTTELADGLERAKDGRVWALATEDQLADDSGMEFVRGICSGDADLVPVLTYGDDGVSDVIEAVRGGVNFHFIYRDEPVEKIARQVRRAYAIRAREEEKRGERRLFPRVHPAGLVVSRPEGCELVDIAAGGVALRVAEPMKRGDRFDFEFTFRVPLRPHVLETEVIRAELDDLGRWAIAARFVDIPANVHTMLLAVTRQHISTLGVRDMQKQFQELAADWMTPISDEEQVAVLFEAARDESVKMRAAAVTGGAPWTPHLLAVDRQARAFEVDAPPGTSMVVPGQTLDLVLQREFTGYIFESEVLDTSQARLRCSFPAMVYYSEKRSRLRHRMGETTVVMAEIESPKRDGSVYQLQVIDFSASGASFEVDLDRHVIYTGTPFSPFKILFNDRVVLREQAQVRHVTPVGQGSMAKVGVRFSRRGQPRDAESPRATGVTATFETPSPATAATRLKFLNSRREEVVALCNMTYRGEDRFEGPVVIIPPAWSYSKESFVAYTLGLIESLERSGRPAAVLRLDFTHHRGESFVPPENRVPGRESTAFLLSNALEDVLAAVRFAYTNPMFSPTELIVFGCSFSAPVALKAASVEPRITHVICPMGTPSTQELVSNSSGGLDYIGRYQAGARHSVVDFLGQLIDMDGAASDAIRHGLAFLDDSIEIVETLETPISWIVGVDDGWVDPGRVEELLSYHAGPNELIRLTAGHLPTHGDAIGVADVATRAVFRRLGLDEDEVVAPTPDLLNSIRAQEWRAAPKAGVESAPNYWRDYLLGGGEDSLGFDVLGMTDAYRDFASTQATMLNLEESSAVLDAGAGTGHFWVKLLTRWHDSPTLQLPREVDLVDLVGDALRRAEGKIRALDVDQRIRMTRRATNLQVSPLLPVVRFLEGEYHGIECLQDRVLGLDASVTQRLVEAYGGLLAPAIHAAIRGGPLDSRVVDAFDTDVVDVIQDLGCLARFLGGEVREDDLKPERRGEGRFLLREGRLDALHAGFLALRSVQLGDARLPGPLALDTERYDRVLASLLLPYLLNPDETLAELCRSLRPGGILVASTMKPDADISKIQRELVHQVTEGAVELPPGWTRDRLLGELRTYTNAAALLLRLTEEGTFRFFTAEQLAEMMEGAGLVDVEVRACFGDPPQAFVAAGRREPS